jgi:Fe-S-cluster containining protein
MSDAAATDLCRSCGLCCNGALFDRAPLQPEEREPARALGLRVTESDGAPYFLQPCTAFGGSVCTVYPNRPAACRRFRCLLLKALERGETSLEAALRTVTKAKAEIAAYAGGGPLATNTERRRLRALGPTGGAATAEGRLSAARRYAKTVALDLFLTKHFRGEKKVGKASPSAAQRDA